MKKIAITSDKLINSNISLGFFTRREGFSNNNFTSLNCNLNSADKKNIVKKNIAKAQNIINPKNKKLKMISQVHSKKVVLIDKDNFNKQFTADGMITQDHNINIAVLTADCCPIFLFDDDASFVSCLHSGWKGCYLNIVENALKKINKIQTNTKKINAIIGPCLNKVNYEVSNDFKEKFLKKNLSYKRFFIKKNDKDKHLFDMRGIIKFQLKEKNISKIEDIDIDTYSNKNLFYSHRRSTHTNNLPTGRMINIIGFSN
jgi:YfiH family protein